ncbi:MAG: ABC transporter permease [Rhodoferax sp.]|nr:ABC transporter permease [Rhodoferax sp.]
MSGIAPARQADRGGATLGLILGSVLLAALFMASPLASGETEIRASFWLASGALGLLALTSIRRLAAIERHPIYASLTAALFGIWVLYFWQLFTVALEVPRVLLPSPWLIMVSLFDNLQRLGNDFHQTVVKAVLVGWALGSALGFAVAVAIDRLPFLQRGLLPVASLTSTIPLVGVAPIMVMWFGFDWPSKAAVVVLMTFFPMLVSTLAGLQASNRLERELMHSYAASYGRTLWSLRLPAALPFMIGALKVNATLALIGAIVAEFFGSPTSGLGFRISTEATKMNMTLVWAAVVVAAITGSVAYALLVALERRAAFWHPSVRGKK